MELFDTSLKPLRECVDSINKTKSEKQNLALVQTRNVNSGKISKCIYILSDDVNNPIKDSIPASAKVKERIEILGVAEMPMDNLMNCTERELDSINRSLVIKKSPIFEFLYD